MRRSAELGGAHLWARHPEFTLQELCALKPENQGRLTVDSWLAYSSEFRLRFSRLHNKSEDEVLDWVLSRVPEMMRTPIF